jgi:hypothetical protein
MPLFDSVKESASKYMVQPDDSGEELKDLAMPDMSEIFDRKELEGVQGDASAHACLRIRS